MPQPIYIPPRQNSWEATLQTMIPNLIMMKMQQNYQTKQADIEQKRWETQNARAEQQIKMALAEDYRPVETTVPSTRTDIPEGTKQTVTETPDITWDGQGYKEKGWKAVEVKGETIGYSRGSKFVKAPVPKTPKTPTYGLFEYTGSEKKGQQFYVPKGSQIPTNAKAVKQAQSVTNINMPKPASAGERKDISDYRANLDALGSLEQLFDSAYTGPLAGRVGQVKDFFGQNPAQQSEFYAASANLKNKVIKAITGAQMSEKEAERIMKEVPLLTDHPNKWKAKMSQSKKNLQRMEKRRIEILKQSGLAAPTSSPQTPASNANDPLGIL